MTIRRLGPDDGAVARHVLAVFKADDGADPASFLGDSRNVLLVAEDAGSVVGWLYAYELARPDGDVSTLLYEVEVLEEHRGRGHGSALVEGLLDLASRAGCTRVWCLADEGNTAAAALYRATGARDGAQSLFRWDVTT